MSTSYRLLAMTVVLVSTVTVSAEDKVKAVNRLAPLERFAGEWSVDGKWSNGDGLKARAVYQWGLGKKIMTSKTFVMNGDKEYQRYEGVFAWHPEKKQLFHISFSFDGGFSEVIVDSKDKDTLNFGFVPFTEGKPQNLRQTIRFLDDDRFQWIVLLKQGEEWKEIMDATWKRKAK
jgi:hypothetical protein